MPFEIPLTPQEIAEEYRVILTYTSDPRRARMLLERYLQGRLEGERIHGNREPIT